MDVEGSAQASAVAGDDHASPKKRRKVNHGMEDHRALLFTFESSADTLDV